MSHPFYDRPDCIITGCWFHSPAESKRLRADLHRLGDCYIIVGNRNDVGEADWQYLEPPHYDRIISVDYPDHYFERRGIVMFTTRSAIFNKVAEDYIAGNTRLPEPPPTYPDTAGDAA
jgi:hypothetical protein